MHCAHLCVFDSVQSAAGFNAVFFFFGIQYFIYKCIPNIHIEQAINAREIYLDDEGKNGAHKNPLL